MFRKWPSGSILRWSLELRGFQSGRSHWDACRCNIGIYVSAVTWSSAIDFYEVV